MTCISSKVLFGTKTCDFALEGAQCGASCFADSCRFTILTAVRHRQRLHRKLDVHDVARWERQHARCCKTEQTEARKDKTDAEGHVLQSAATEDLRASSAAEMFSLLNRRSSCATMLVTHLSQGCEHMYIDPSL